MNFPDGPWKKLLLDAYGLIDSISDAGFQVPLWSLGGGTVLMFHYGHRRSKDIDIFVPDPQFLGYINPRLGGPAEDLTQSYKDAATYVKLFLPEGEIDFVATSTLTENPFMEAEVLGRNILLETPVEIVAKKIWHRGDTATARDLFDLACVANHDLSSIVLNGGVFRKNIDVFVDQCLSRRAFMEKQFDQLEKFEPSMTFDECLSIADNLRKTIGKQNAIKPA